VTFVYDAGADMANERPEAVAAALADFMRQRERYVVTDRSAKRVPILMTRPARSPRRGG